MKSSKQKKSLFISSIILGLMTLLSFQCSTNKKQVNPIVTNPGSVIDTISNPNNSSPNNSENEAQWDSIKKAEIEKKKKVKKKKSDKKDQ